MNKPLGKIPVKELTYTEDNTVKASTKKKKNPRRQRQHFTSSSKQWQSIPIRQEARVVEIKLQPPRQFEK